MMKVAVIVLADTETHADLARVVNALITVQEFKEEGGGRRGAPPLRWRGHPVGGRARQPGASLSSPV